MSTNWFDICLVLIILWSAITGLRAGFARVIVGFIAVIAGMLVGFWCYQLVAARLMPWVGTAMAANILGCLVIFMGVLIAGGIISSLLSRVFNWFGLSWANHALGGLAGFVRGAFLIAALVDVAVAFAPYPTPQVLENSRVLPYASELSSWLVSVAPGQLREAFTQQMENLRQLWGKPDQQKQQPQPKAQGEVARLS